MLLGKNAVLALGECATLPSFAVLTPHPTAPHQPQPHTNPNAAASRDALVKFFVHLLPDGRYVNVATSLPDHPAYHSRSGDVRMLARLAGQLVERDPLGRPNACRVIQVMDGDLCGWIPQAVVSMITTQAFPVAMRKVNKLLRAVSAPRTESRLILEAEGKLSPAELAGSGEVGAGAGAATGEAPKAEQAPLEGEGRALVPSTTPALTRPSIGIAPAAPAPAPRASGTLRSFFCLATRYLGLVQPWLVALLVVVLVVLRPLRRKAIAP